MKRREALKSFAVFGAGLVATPKLVRAMEVEQDPVEESGLQIQSEIGRNHGHSFSLDLNGLVLLLRQAHVDQAPQAIDIQGDSRHPHTVLLSEELLLTLLVEGVIELESTVDFGHAHLVQITLA